jgi:hypothetical protein
MIDYFVPCSHALDFFWVEEFCNTYVGGVALVNFSFCNTYVDGVAPAPSLQYPFISRVSHHGQKC